MTSAFEVRASPGYVLVGADGRIAGTGGSVDECLRTDRR
jgi:hypothetical protein